MGPAAGAQMSERPGRKVWEVSCVLSATLRQAMRWRTTARLGGGPWWCGGPSRSPPTACRASSGPTRARRCCRRCRTNTCTTLGGSGSGQGLARSFGWTGSGLLSPFGSSWPLVTCIRSRLSAHSRTPRQASVLWDLALTPAPLPPRPRRSHVIFDVLVPLFNMQHLFGVYTPNAQVIFLDGRGVALGAPQGPLPCSGRAGAS